MTDDNAPAKKKGSTPGWVWALIILLLGVPLIAGIAAVVIITALVLVGQNLEATFDKVSSGVEQADRQADE